MSLVAKHLTEGGIPRDWTVHNLLWLAQAHWRFADAKNQANNHTRADWHRRWAALLSDLLESAREHRH